MWEDVFPGLTGDYKWAQKVAASAWNRDGQMIAPEMMWIFKCEDCKNAPTSLLGSFAQGGIWL